MLSKLKVDPLWQNLQDPRMPSCTDAQFIQLSKHANKNSLIDLSIKYASYTCYINHFKILKIF